MVYTQNKVIKPTNTRNLKWQTTFQNTRDKAFEKGQIALDNEVIKQMKPYTPKLQGHLENSATTGTQKGSGVIVQQAPQARYLYYGMLMVSPTTGSSYAKKNEEKVKTDVKLKYNKTNLKAGSHWFERMKKDKKDDLLRFSAKVLGASKVKGYRIK